MALKDSKHEKFTQLWHEGLSKAEAFRQSHPSSKNWKDATIHNRASALSKQNEIQARFDELQDLAIRSHNVTVESLIKELNEARGIALEQDNPQTSAAITATMSKAKLVGLDRNIVDQNVIITKRTTLDDFYN